MFYLAYDIFVGKPDNQSELGRVVLVLVLNSQSLPGVVIGFSLTTPLEFNLETLEVLLVFHNFDETLRKAKLSLFVGTDRFTMLSHGEIH